MKKSRSALGLGDPEEKNMLIFFLTAPQDFSQKACRVGQKRHFWPSKARGAVKKSVRGPFSSGSPSPNAELDLHAGFFENSSVGLSYAAFRTVNDVKNVENWVKVNPKRGSIFRCPPKYLIFLDAKFNGDVIFAIRHDLIWWSDLVLGVQSWGTKTGDLPVCNLNISWDNITRCSLVIILTC